MTSPRTQKRRDQRRRAKWRMMLAAKVARQIGPPFRHPPAAVIAEWMKRRGDMLGHALQERIDREIIAGETGGKSE